MIAVFELKQFPYKIQNNIVKYFDVCGVRIAQREMGGNALSIILPDNEFFRMIPEIAKAFRENKKVFLYT